MLSAQDGSPRAHRAGLKFPFLHWRPLSDTDTQLAHRIDSKMSFRERQTFSSQTDTQVPQEIYREATCHFHLEFQNYASSFPVECANGKERLLVSGGKTES